MFKKIFRGYDFRNNKIINAKTDTPTHNDHLVNKIYVDTLKLAKVLSNITLSVGDNILIHNLASTHIICLFRINNNNDMIETFDLKENLTFILDYTKIDENSISVNTKVELTGDIILISH
jgi:hypothetical protein